MAQLQSGTQAVKNIYQDAGAEVEDRLHAPGAAGLRHRRAHHGAGRGRARADRLLPEPAVGRAARPVRPVRRRRPLARDRVRARHHAVHLGAASSSRSRRPWCRTVEKMQKEEEGRKKITQWTRYPRWCSPCCRRGATRCSPSRCRARCRHPGFGFKRGDGALPHHGRDVRDVAGRADHRARPRQRRVAADLLLDRRAHSGRASGRRAAIVQTGAHRRRSRSLVLGVVMVARGGGGRWRSRWRRGACRSRSRSARWRAGGMRESGEELHPAAHQRRRASCRSSSRSR